MKRTSFVAGTLLAFAPLAALISGCGGGSNGGISPTATPVGTATVTPIGTATVTPVGTATVSPTATSFPTATPVPTNTPISVGTVKYDVTFTRSGGSNFQDVALSNARLNLRTSDSTNTLQFVTRGSFNNNSIALSGNLVQAEQGKFYTASSPEANTIQIENQVNANGSTRIGVYRLQSGTILITRFTSSNAIITFNNAVFSAQTSSGATGTVEVSGTLNGPYSTNQSF